MTEIAVGKPILSRNAEQAERNRARFRAAGLLTINVLSSPGSGKTAFLCRTFTDLAPGMRCGVIVGDLATDLDARRLRASGAQAVQIETGTRCHLEAAGVAEAADVLPLDALDLLAVENVGNLVCPAAYDLGEDFRVVLLSVTEGEDKPLKYPVMFKSAHVIILNKIDLADVVGFDRGRVRECLRAMCPEAAVFEVSARTGDGMAAWYGWLSSRRPVARQVLGRGTDP